MNKDGYRRFCRRVDSIFAFHGLDTIIEDSIPTGSRGFNYLKYCNFTYTINFQLVYSSEKHSTKTLFSS